MITRNQEFELQPRPNTFAQSILPLSFFACDKAADHTFQFARQPPVVSALRSFEAPISR